MKVFTVPVDGSNYITRSLKDAVYNAECELENMEPGQEITIGVEKMTQEEFDALPDSPR